MRRRLERMKRLLASNVLEAELLAAARREGVDLDPSFLGAIWILPDWHLATALFLAEDPSSLVFPTLDERQRDAAGSLGFPV